MQRPLVEPMQTCSIQHALDIHKTSCSDLLLKTRQLSLNLLVPGKAIAEQQPSSDIKQYNEF